MRRIAEDEPVKRRKENVVAMKYPDRFRFLYLLTLVLLVVGINRAPAGSCYVALSGDNSAGTNWTTAFTSLQRALTVAGTGAEIRVKADPFRIGVPIDLSGQLNVRIRGGYAGTIREPDRLAARLSRFMPQTGCSIRLFYGNATTVTLERIGIEGGHLTNELVNAGAGLYFTGGSDVTLRNCSLTHNRCEVSGPQAGGALYMTGGVLVVENCRFESNALNKVNWNTQSLGGGAGVVDAVSVWSQVVFTANSVWTRHCETYGGALWLSGGQAGLVDCVFTDNYTTSEGNLDNPGPARGGALHADAVTPLTIDDTLFVANRLVTPADTGAREGGALYLGGSAGNAILRRCVFIGNGDGGEEKGDLFIAAGSLALTNILIANSAGGSGLFNQGGSIQAMHCTFANNRLYGIYSAAFSPVVSNGIGGISDGSQTGVRNSIVWGNGAGGVMGPVTVSYTLLQEPLAGVGNLVTDPIFGETTFFHLLSRAGHYEGGYFSGGSWRDSLRNSPCIDAGDPASPWLLEPEPNGSRVNLGAYGNTPGASMSVEGKVKIAID